MKNNVLVTGATGFIGSNLCQRLVKEGHNVITIIRDEKKNDSLKILNLWDKVTRIRGDITNYHFVERLISDYEIDTIFHLAAQAIVREAKESPLSTYNINIMGTVNVLEACRRTSTVKTIVVASSDKVYGDSDILPYKEDFLLNAKNVYDSSKLCTDVISRTYYNEYDLPIVVLRPSNIYGGCDLNMSRIIPKTIKQCFYKDNIKFQKRVPLYREFLYIDDIVNAYIFSIKNIDKMKGEVYNVGTGQLIEMEDLLKKILEIYGKDIDVNWVEDDRSFKEINKQYTDSTKLQNLGWKAKYNIDDGLKLTIDWYKQYFEGLK